MIVALGTLLGGIGLFLLGMQHLTDGLKQSAGERIDYYLQAGTSTGTKAFLSGFSLTALVQSSSIVTVATIGFSNAGLLSLGQATWIVYGSNVGTTMTAWIVALVGFKIKVEAFALPIVGVGMFMNLLGKSARLRSLGKAATGFGLLFVGLNLLQGALGEHKEQLLFLQSAQLNILNVLLLLLLGFLMTLVMQSSSASMAMILTLVNAQAIPLTLGAAAVIGANIGTCSTALLATIGATPNAKRVAWSHVIFNLVAALAALLMMPLVSEVFHVAYEQKLMGGNAAFWLAIFHTLFNLVGVTLMIFLEPSVTRYLNKRFTAMEQTSLRLKYIDATTAEMPAMAAQTVRKELNHLLMLLMNKLQDSNWRNNAEKITNMEKLLARFDDYVIGILRQPMSDEQAEMMSQALHCSKTMADILLMRKQYVAKRKANTNTTLLEILDQVQQSFDKLIDAIQSGQKRKLISELVRATVKASRQAEAQLLQLINTGALPNKAIHSTLNKIALLEKIAKLLNKQTRWQRQINRNLEIESDPEQVN